MVLAPFGLRGSLLLSVGVLLAACPDDPIPSDTEPGTTSSTDTGSGCDPGEIASCTCEDGREGTQVCEADGQGFSPCECEAATSAVDDTSTGGTDETTAGEESTGPGGCVSDDECMPVSGACWVGLCLEDGSCSEQWAPPGTPCGDPNDDECTAPDTCAGSVCVSNDVDDGLSCTDCPSGQCACAAGACGDCPAFAVTNSFNTARSVAGWTFTGSWGLKRQTPQSQLELPSRFPGQVIGSDGNRVAPFPGAETEVSYARTPPVVLPATLGFLSWHIDEGGGTTDNKTVRVSTDGGMSWDTLADCAVDPSYVFCEYRDTGNPAVWYPALIPVPPALQGQVAIVEFGYDTGDSCCDFEKGWYIDSLNFATECACGADSDCDAYSDTCGTGICQLNGECGLDPMPDDTACGDPFDNDCNGADLCDGVGYCDDNEAANGLSLCGDCPSGACSFCDGDQCLDCLSYTDFGDFSDPAGVATWQVISITGTPDWGLYDEAPPNEDLGSLPIPFPNAPVYGTDGNRNPPYPGEEEEHSQVITNMVAVPAEISFMSWNVDEGDFFDTKRIDISVNGGMTWNNLVDCAVAPTQPFCNFVDEGRAANDWDLVVLDTSMWMGQPGQLRFSYDTGDSCCTFERGWYIDDLSFASYCDDEPFPP